jgi:Tol biopolymer transport system component
MRVGGGGIVDGVSGGGNIAWSPDGRRIAAVSDVGAGALVVVPLRGRVRTVKLPRRGFPENINFDFGNLSDAVGAWSPDGRRLLYAAGSRLCTVADARARCVAKRFTRLFLAVSWHARRIAFVRPAPRQHTALLAVAAGGSRPTPLTNDGGLPTAMPDGRVAFVVDHSNKDPQDWAVDPIGGTRTRLPFDFAQTPVWSPDGGRIAVASGLAGESVSVGNADGTGLHEIARGESSPYPAWSPDGKRIAFTALSSLRVAVVDADGSHRTDLPLGGTTPGPVWSPGGSLLLGAYAFGALGPGLDEFGLDGTARAQLAGIDATRALPSAITVSPDGEWIAFTTGWGEARLGPGGADDGIAGWRLWLVRPDGSDLHRIAAGDVEHTVSGLAWSGTR